METKAELREETIAKLQDLIRVNLDSAKGFREAAEMLEDSLLSGKLLGIADQREANAKDLQTYVTWNDEEPRKEGSYAAAVHRCWMKTRELLPGNDKHAVLAEAERGEDHIKEAYEDALEEEPGSAMNDVLVKQYADVKVDHDVIRELRDNCKEQC